jgi:phosphoglucosamine mutase
MKYFGTDGIRSTFNKSFPNENFAYSLAEALTSFILKKQIQGRQIVIGHDTRPSGKLLLNAFLQGLHANGFTGLSAGVIPTPALAYATMKKKMSMGVMITASHNPVQDNGFKFFTSLGTKLSDSEEAEIENMILQNHRPRIKQDSKSLEIIDSYLDHLMNFFPRDLLKNKIVVIDLSNGATQKTTPRLFEKLGADVRVYNDGPSEINAGVGSEYPSMMAGKVKELKADFGIAHDGDGDRVIFCDSAGNVIPGDKILGLLAINEKKQHRLLNNAMVATIHSNSGLDASLKERGISLHRADVGDRKVAEMMRNRGCNIGGESSGHVVASDYLPTGDGLLTALLVARASYESKRTIDSLSEDIVLWPSFEGSFKVKEKLPIQECDLLSSNLSKVKISLGNQGRVLLRYSGTELKIRLLVEAIEQNKAKEAYDSLAKTIVKSL